MSQDSEYPEHAPESFYDRLADRPWSPEDIPDADTLVDAGAIYSKVRNMSPDERREIGGSATISSAAEKLVHEEVYGIAFNGPIDVDFKRERGSSGKALGHSLSELRLSVSNSPHGGYGEDAHRAFRSFPFEAGAYREKYHEMLQEYDDNRKAERKIQETKNRVKKRVESMEEEITERAKAHPAVEESDADRAKRHGKLSRLELPGGGRLSIEPSDRGRGVDLTAQRLDPEFAFIVLSVLQEGHGGLIKLLGRVSKALEDAGYSALRDRLFDFFDTGDAVQW